MKLRKMDLIGLLALLAIAFIPMVVGIITGSAALMWIIALGVAPLAGYIGWKFGEEDTDVDILLQ